MIAKVWYMTVYGSYPKHYHYLKRIIVYNAVKLQLDTIRRDYKLPGNTETKGVVLKKCK